MSVLDKISPSLLAYVEDGSAKEVHETIVVLRSDRAGSGPASGFAEGARASTEARKAVVERARASTRAAQRQVLEAYLPALRKEVGSGYLRSDELAADALAAPGSSPRGTSILGKGSLPLSRMPVTRTTLEDLAKLDVVEAVLPNLRLRAIESLGSEYGRPDAAEREAKKTWGLRVLDVEALWEQGFDGSGIRVGVLDTGVDGAHPSLEGRVDDFAVFDPSGRPFEVVGGASFDCDRHGTHVCGTIAGGRTPDGVAIGVAPGARLVVGSVLLGRTTLATLLAGVEWAVDRGCRVVNLSLGLAAYEPKLGDVARRLLDDLDVMPVGAIGNRAHGNSDSPGNVPDVLGVGAIERGHGGRLAVPFFSSGASLLVGPDSGGEAVHKPDLCAPGRRVYSCVPMEDRYEGVFEHAYLDGTSMAAPHVSGCAALLMQAVPEARAAEVFDALRLTARPPRKDMRRTSPGGPIDNRWGYGMVDPVGALDALRDLVAERESRPQGERR